MQIIAQTLTCMFLIIENTSNRQCGAAVFRNSLWVWGPCWKGLMGALQLTAVQLLDLFVPPGHRGCHRWQCLPAQQSEPVDNKRGGTNPEPAHKAGEALQVHW